MNPLQRDYSSVTRLTQASAPVLHSPGQSSSPEEIHQDFVQLYIRLQLATVLVLIGIDPRLSEGGRNWGSPHTLKRVELQCPLLTKLLVFLLHFTPRVTEPAPRITTPFQICLLRFIL